MPLMRAAEVAIYAHAIPSATAFGVKPEVSLYDHSKAVAALAVALWRYHHDREDDQDATTAAMRMRTDWDEEKLLLVQGDLFGIQDFIFAAGGETQRRAAKLLRGRSFYVGLLAECAALKVLDALGLPPTSQISLAIKLQFVTAQRKGEVIGARLDEFDLKTGWWTIPADRAKNKIPHRVPLSEKAFGIIDEALDLAGDSEWLFPSPKTGRPITGPAVDHAVRKNMEAFGMEHWTPHDLRRTAASHMTGNGISRLTVSKILNHVDSSITAVYDRHSYDAEKKQALYSWANVLDRIITGKQENNAVQLQR